MKQRIKKIMSFILVIAVLAGICPTTNRESRAATSSASLHNLGGLGSLSVGSKTKSGSWWKIFVGSSEVFCLNMGYTCHTGDVYASEVHSYSSNSSGKDKLLACVGYWYAHTKKRNGKAYVFAQGLFWAIEEGDTSESKLKSALTTLKSNTGYFSDKTVDKLYSEIFQPGSTVSVEARIWKYSGSGSHRQQLMEIVTTEHKDFNPKHLHESDVYRQRITLDKVDELGMPVSGVEFKLTADNIDELYFFRANGLGEPESGDVDEDIDHFELSTKTDSNGRIAYRFNYNIQSKEFYYYTDDELHKMSADDIKTAKQKLDDEGYSYDSSLTKTGAESLAKNDIDSQLKKIKNKYTIQEIKTDDNNLLLNPDYANGKTITLDDKSSWRKESDGVWPETRQGTYADYFQAYLIKVENKYKKLTVNVKKQDSHSSDKKAHGDATLDGALFDLFEDAACTKQAKIYTEKGEPVTGTLYKVENGTFETGYLLSGKTYYLKEIQAPEGYKISNSVMEIKADGSTYSVEYIRSGQTEIVQNAPVLGRIAIQKYSADGKAGLMPVEKGASFQIYLKSKGSYDNADDYERDTIVTDDKGYACSKNLYYGNYVIHQTGTGGNDTERVADFEAMIDQERQSPYLFVLNNPVFKAYLRVIKKDATTEKNVLKPGTSYQIYQVDKLTGEETLVRQSYRDGHTVQTVDCFSTDDTGTIMTVEPLPSGSYRIYEREAAEGYHISTDYIEIEITSSSEANEAEMDSNGGTYTVVTANYVNNETYGKLLIRKTGEQLSKYENGQFVYESRNLKGVVLDIFADEDIVTQDNQESKWFNKDDLVATVKTGSEVTFEDLCGGICKGDVDEDGTAVLCLPLGKYRVVERKTNYGFILADQVWKISLDWKNSQDEYVLNSTDVTNDKGILSIQNDRAKTAVSLFKKDSESEKPIRDAGFVLKSKDDIYNVDGEKIISAGTVLGTILTGADGRAEFDYDLPMKSELNTGDYLIQEISAPAGYYFDSAEIPVHLEYKDDKTKVISINQEVKEKQTTVEIDKLSIAGSEEIAGCEMQIADSAGNIILSWTSGDKDSVHWTDYVEEAGYQNLVTTFDEKGSIHIGGLFRDTDYLLTETRPADGYVTADTIPFRITKDAENIVKMYDETTKIEFHKIAADTQKLLNGAKIQVLNHEGEEVYSFITKKLLPEKIEGILKVGEIYTFHEVSAPKSYSTADDVEFTVQDTSEYQRIDMKDQKYVIKKESKTPKSEMDMKVPKSGNRPKQSKSTGQPKTGATDYLVPALFGAALSGTFVGVLGRRRRKKMNFSGKH